MSRTSVSRSGDEEEGRPDAATPASIYTCRYVLKSSQPKRKEKPKTRPPLKIRWNLGPRPRSRLSPVQVLLEEPERNSMPP